MNPQYMPQPQFGAPPSNFGPMRPGPSNGPNDFNTQNQSNQPPGPYGQKGPIGPPSLTQANVGQTNLMQSPGMPPMISNSQPGQPPQGSFPPPQQGQQMPPQQGQQMPPQRLNGPSIGMPGQYPSQIGSPRNMYPSQMATSPQGSQKMPGPPPNQLPPQTNHMGPPPSQLPPQKNDVNNVPSNQMPPPRMGMPQTGPAGDQMSSMQGPPRPPMTQGPPKPGMPNQYSQKAGSAQQYPGMPPSSSNMGPHGSGPGMPASGPGIPSALGMPPSSSGMSLSGPGIPPPGMPLSGPGIPPSGPGMPSSGPGIPPTSQGISLSGPGMPQSGSGMPAPGSGMPPLSSGMPPPGSGMPPPGSGMPPPGSGMLPPGSGMLPSGPGMPPSGPGNRLPNSGIGMPPSGPGMPPLGPGMPPSGPGMPPSGPGMQASGPGMQASGPGMQPSGLGMPPSGPGMPPPGPGMPPPGPGIPPPGPGQQNYNQGFMPPTSLGPNQLTNQMSSMQIGGQRQYPALLKPAMNGESSPHMPPPLNQGQYNGSQVRSPQQMGYPPMPAQQQMPGGPYPPQPSYQQPQQARRLDPDQMPSPIQVTQDDQRTRSGIFCTNQKGLVPPLVSTSFITQDQGNVNPRFIRSTMYNVPTTTDIMKQTSVPFGLVISPLARTADQEYPPPIVDFGELGPVRCIRCKAYMCPYMQFIDSGKRFQCLFCKATTEVPTEYFQHLDHTGLRVDRFERPELILGTYEFVATKDYCRNNTFPKPPAIIFVIDVSYNNVKSGLVHLLCSEMKEILKNLPLDQGQERSTMKVGFITYNNTVHFYNIKGNLAQPQMMIVGDTQDMFMPLLDGFLCDVEESAAVIDSLMQQIPAMFSDTRDTEVLLLPAIQAGLEALKASECSGKLLVFHSTLPTFEAPGRLKNRDDRKLLGTEKERTILQPQTQAYNQLGMDCVASGCSVDLFVFNNSYIDVATIGQVCRLSGGELFKYTYFQADVDGKRLITDVITDISRPIAFDTIMRVRTSTGIRPTDFYGHFYMSNTTDMEIASIDCDKAVAVEIKHDDKLTEEEGVYIQVALLYTSCSGQRRLRVMNLSLKTCSQMADLYRCCDLDTLINFLSKQSVYRLLDNNPKAVKDGLINRCAQILATYRKNCASPSSAGQLILPECMKLLPLYVNCLLKSDALSGGPDMTVDDRSYVMQAIITMDIPSSVVYFYPRLIPLHEIENMDNPEIPNPIRCTVEKMVDNGVYLLENGIHMLLWIGAMANPEWIQNVFGVSTATQVNTEKFELPELDNPLSLTIRNLIDQVQFQRHRCMRLTLVKQRDKLEIVFRHFLVEDRGNDGSSSYIDFLCHMHKEIRQLLS